MCALMTTSVPGSKRHAVLGASLNGVFPGVHPKNTPLGLWAASRAVRPREPTESVVRFETPAGRQGQVDFATFTLPWGRRHALVVVLSHSRLLWLCFYRRQTMAVLTDGLERAFARFGGVPKELLFDQMRAVVLSDQRVGGGELVLNAEFLRFAAHWGFHPRACRPYRAQTKGKVERPIRYIRDSFFYGRTFANDEDLNEQASRWLEGTANVRRHGTTGEPPSGPLRAGRACGAASRGTPSLPASRRPPRCRAGPPARARHHRGGAPVVAGLRGGGGMTATASDRRDRLRAMLADLKMPGALEAVDGVLAQVDSGAVTAGEAIELVAGRPDRAAQQPSLAGRHALLAPAGRQDAGAV